MKKPTAKQDTAEALTAVTEVLDAGIKRVEDPLVKAALCFCALTLHSLIPTTQTKQPKPSQAPPPSSPVLTITEAPDGTPRVNAKAHAAAVKAAATRKANKEKSAGPAKPGDAAGNVKAGTIAGKDTTGFSGDSNAEDT